MSEISVDFTFLFDADDLADSFEEGFSAIHEERYADAKKYFATKSRELWGEDDCDNWWLQHYDRDGCFYSGAMTFGTLSYEEERFFGAITSLGATHILANVFNDQVGEGHTFASRNGKKCSATTVMREFSKVNSVFALGAAIDKSKKKEALQLIEAGTDPNGMFGGSSFLPLAIYNGQTKVVEALLGAGADPDGTMALWEKRQGGGATALQIAIMQKKGKILEQLLNAGANPNKIDALGQSALHYAVGSRREYKLAERLIEHGATVNEPKDDNDLSPFMEFLTYANDIVTSNTSEWRIKAGNDALTLFNVMVENGLSIDDSCKGGNPKWYACMHRAIGKQLAEMGCVELVAPDGAYQENTTFENIKTAILHRDERKFVAEVADINNLSQKKKDELLWTAITYNHNAIKAVVEGGADTNARIYNQTPLYRNFEESNPEGKLMIAYLKQRASHSIALERERFEHALKEYFAFERWYVGLGDCAKDTPNVTPYYTENFNRRWSEILHSQQYAPLFMAMCNESSDEPFVHRYAKDGDISVGRTFVFEGRKRTIALLATKVNKKFLFDNLVMDYPISKDDPRGVIE